MQVARPGNGEWRTGEERVGTCPEAGDNPGETGVIPQTGRGAPARRARGGGRGVAAGWGTRRNLSRGGAHPWEAGANPAYGPRAKAARRLWSGLRPISLLAGERPTKGPHGSWAGGGGRH